MSGDLSDLSMLELFRMEAESQIQTLTTSLLGLEREPGSAALLESCMRAAHSLKGAARIIDLRAAVAVTHAMEDCFVAAQQGKLSLRKPQIDLLLRGVDLIGTIAAASESQVAGWGEQNPPEVDAFLTALAEALAASDGSLQEASAATEPAGLPLLETTRERGADRVLRVTARNFDRLLGLAGESLVQSRRLPALSSSLLRLRRLQHEALKSLDGLRDALAEGTHDERTAAALSSARGRLGECQTLLAEQLRELESFDRRTTSLSQRLYEEVLRCRMRPLADGVHAFPRMVRDLAHALGKQARLEIVGALTELDRDVLDKLEAPLSHLLRNAVDHGIDAPERRLAVGKQPEGLIRLEARHAAGLLQIAVYDDGQGIDTERVRATIVARGLTDAQTAERLSESELYEFLLLPGFTVREQVTDISGRGVGLDAVHVFAKQLGGSVQVSSQPGKGARFQLQLPVSVSVVRSLVAEIGGEPYAFPLAQIERVLTVPRSQIQLLEGRQHVQSAGRQLGLVGARQLFGGSDAELEAEELQVIVLAEHEGAYGLVVERIMGVRELVVQVLDPRLGKIKDIAAGALLEDGTPLLIVDVEDLVRSIQKLIAVGHLGKVQVRAAVDRSVRQKRVLVVDDSLTVRELERKLIESGGYGVEVAVDGIDGWNAVRSGDYDLVVTDVDMPRMDGIDLVKLIRKDARLAKLPVMIVSYKDREEDRQRGLEAGADFYLAKGSFHNERLLEAVVDLIGEA